MVDSPSLFRWGRGSLIAWELPCGLLGAGGIFLWIRNRKPEPTPMENINRELNETGRSELIVDGKPKWTHWIVGDDGQVFRSVGVSPSGEQFRVTLVKKPFSYYVPAERFGSIEGIWDREGKALSTLVDRKLRETEPQPPIVATAPTGKGFGKKGTGLPPTPPADPDNPQAVKEPTDPDGKRDLALLKTLKAQGIPAVSVFLSGRPLWTNPEINASDAFVAAWLPGIAGGGVADVLIREPGGAVNHDFIGKLSYPWPRRGEQPAKPVRTD